jgi:hypothetical protein
MPPEGYDVAEDQAAIAQGDQVRFAYADPPYIGQAKRHYSHDPRCAEVDHLELINRLVSEFPDGWALSASTPSLAIILPMCPPGWRMGAWCKSFCAFKRNVRPAYAWEPVIYWGGRNPMNGYPAEIPERNGKQTTPKDFLVEPITLQKGLVGAKPEKVCRWILELLNFQRGDELVDLYPGTGIMGRVAAMHSSQLEITEQPA